MNKNNISIFLTLIIILILLLINNIKEKFQVLSYVETGIKKRKGKKMKEDKKQMYLKSLVDFDKRVEDGNKRFNNSIKNLADRRNEKQKTYQTINKDIDKRILRMKQDKVDNNTSLLELNQELENVENQLRKQKLDKVTYQKKKRQELENKINSL
jgi:hypothetical protein